MSQDPPKLPDPPDGWGPRGYPLTQRWPFKVRAVDVPIRGPVGPIHFYDLDFNGFAAPELDEP